MRPRVTANGSRGLVVRLACLVEVDPSFGAGPTWCGTARPPSDHWRHRVVACSFTARVCLGSLRFVGSGGAVRDMALS